MDYINYKYQSNGLSLLSTGSFEPVEVAKNWFESVSIWAVSIWAVSIWAVSFWAVSIWTDSIGVVANVNLFNFESNSIW